MFDLGVLKGAGNPWLPAEKWNRRVNSLSHPAIPFPRVVGNQTEPPFKSQKELLVVQNRPFKLLVFPFQIHFE